MGAGAARRGAGHDLLAARNGLDYFAAPDRLAVVRIGAVTHPTRMSTDCVASAAKR